MQIGRDGEPVTSLGALPPILKENCRATAGLLAKIGFQPPWVGNVCVVGDQAVGGCAFIGAPKYGAVEIAYYTLEEHEGRGFATQAVKAMIEIARREGGAVRLTAKTLPAENASTAILRRAGFRFVGETADDDIGLAWGWRLELAPGAG